MKKNNYVLTVLALMAGLGLFLCCCDDCPTCPKPQEPVLGHYRIYGFDGIQGLLMSIDTPADTVVDSIRVNYNGDFIFVTPDGNRLLVMYNDNYTNRIEVYSTIDLAHIGTLDQPGFYYFDGGDNYGLCNSGSDGKIYFIDPNSLLPIDTINRAAGQGYLDTVINQFFAAAAGGKIYKIDCNTRTLVDSFTNLYGGNVWSPAYNRLTNDIYYFTFISSYYSYFVQYDCDGDSVIDKTILTQATGGISISPDCRRVYMTDGGNGMLGTFPPGEIWVFDALTNRPLTWIAPYNVASGRRLRTTFGQIVITPDNNRAYIGAAISAGGPVPLPIIDLNTNRIIKTVFFFFLRANIGAMTLAIGPVPN